jgi:hypothetical protein
MEIERIKVWECIGCGRIDHPQPCIGVCSDRKAEFVRAGEHDAALAAAHAEAQDLRELVLRIACVTPRASEWESTYRALQARARVILETQRRTEDA